MSQNGFLIVNQLLDPREVDLLRDDIERFEKSVPPEYEGDVIRGDQGLVNRISHPLFHSKICRHTYGNPRVLELAYDFYGDDLVPFAESVATKHPGNGAAFGWHQDSTCKTGNVSERGLNIGIYLHDSTTDNGCLHVVPGSHRQGRIDVAGLVDKYGFRLPGAIPAPVKAGDAIVHGRTLLHGSPENHSATKRITYYVGFHRRQSIEGVHDESAILAKQQLLSLAIEERTDSGLFPNEESFTGIPLPDVPDLTEPQRQALLRSDGLGI